MSLPSATSASARPDPWFAKGTRALLIWVACCNFVTVGAATYLFWDQNVVVRVVSALAALAVGIIAALGISSLAARGDAPSAHEPGHPENKPARTLGHAESAAPAVRKPQPERLRVEAQLATQLAVGTRLRSRLEQASSDGTPNGTKHVGPQIDGWIDETRALLEDNTPDLAEYFATDKHDTPETNWPPKLEDAIKMSQAGRLNRHLDRLTEILSRGGASS